VRLAGNTLGESCRKAGLADPRLARDQHNLPFALPGETLAFQQEIELILATDEIGQTPRVDGLEAALGSRHTLDRPRRDRLGNTLDIVPAEVAQTKQIAEQTARGGGMARSIMRARTHMADATPVEWCSVGLVPRDFGCGSWSADGNRTLAAPPPPIPPDRPKMRLPSSTAPLWRGFSFQSDDESSGPQGCTACCSKHKIQICDLYHLLVAQSGLAQVRANQEPDARASSICSERALVGACDSRAERAGDRNNSRTTRLALFPSGAAQANKGPANLVVHGRPHTSVRAEP
jgi:hypothetical protein